MVNNPVLSVCLITYNHQNYITQAIESVLKQKTNFKYEIIIADDFSIDNTREILIYFKNKYPDIIKLILRDKNLGAHKNWMDLLFLPNTKYISYLEGDDFWIDELKLQKQFDFLERNKDFVLCAANSVKIKDNIILNNDDSKTYSRNTILNSINLLVDFTFNPIPSAGILFRKSILEKLDFSFIQKCTFGDWPLLIEFSQKGKIYFFSEVFSAYRITEKGHHTGVNTKEQKRRIIEFYNNVSYKYPELSVICQQQVDKVLDEFSEYIGYEWGVFFTKKLEDQKKYLTSRSAILDNNSLFSIFKLLFIKFLNKNRQFIINF